MFNGILCLRGAIALGCVQMRSLCANFIGTSFITSQLPSFYQALY
ncbi:hypothetical protein [Nostoc sp. FACHB-152]|nr:hypothetical protein [Nostoc sp. FACHB-152]